MNSKRNYPLLLASQFLSAFGDNAILAVIVGQLTLMQKAGVITSEQLRTSNTLYTSLLFVPYVVLAPLAGWGNDRFAKTQGLAAGNLIKLLGTLVCAASIVGGYIWQAPGYVIVGIGSCIYGPAKYGILPEILPYDRLVKANGMVELLTLLAILGGAIAGSVMIDKLSVGVCYAILVAIFLGSWALNLCMDRTAANREVRLGSSLAEFFEHFGGMLRAPRLGKVLIGTTLFWVCGAAMKINFQPWGLDVLQLPDNTQIALLGLWLSVGVMAGSLLAGAWHGVGDLRRTRVYGFGLAALIGALFTVDRVGFWRQGMMHLGPLHLVLPVVGLLVATGIAAGLFLIPLNAALQAESDSTSLGKTIAAQNVCDNLGMLFAGGLVFGCVRAGLSSGEVFGVLAALVVAVAVWLRIPGRP